MDRRYHGAVLDQIELSLRARPGRPVQGIGLGVARAAVAAVINPQAELLFIRRAERVGDPWSGHVAFPGGRAEAGDEGPVGTAVRETVEEVGLALPDAGRLLGPLDELLAPVRRGPPQLVISPFVFHLQRLQPLRPNVEVASVHWLSLERLAMGEGRSSFDLEWGGATLRMPCIELSGLRIWGLTLRMLDDLLERMGGQTSPDVELLHGEDPRR